MSQDLQSSVDESEHMYISSLFEIGRTETSNPYLNNRMEIIILIIMNGPITNAIKCSTEVLKMRSPFFHQLFICRDENESSISITEDDPKAAIDFILKLHEINFSVAGFQQNKLNWDLKWAMLSVKWQINEYIVAFVQIALMELTKIMNDLTNRNEWRYFICSMSLNPNHQNNYGVDYDDYDDYGIDNNNIDRCRAYYPAGTKDCSIVKCINSNCRSGILFCPNGCDLSSHISRSKTCSSCAATLVTYNYDKNNNRKSATTVYNSKRNLNKIVDARVKLFWELVEFMLIHASSFCKEPLANGSDLVRILSTRKDLWNKEKMKKFLDIEDLLALLEMAS
eukprot:gene11289-15146_t